MAIEAQDFSRFAEIAEICTSALQVRHIRTAGDAKFKKVQGELRESSPQVRHPHSRPSRGVSGLGSVSEVSRYAIRTAGDAVTSYFEFKRYSEESAHAIRTPRCGRLFFHLQL